MPSPAASPLRPLLPPAASPLPPRPQATVNGPTAQVSPDAEASTGWRTSNGWSGEVAGYRETPVPGPADEPTPFTRQQPVDTDDTEAIPVADPRAYRSMSFGAAAVDGLRYDGPPAIPNGATPSSSAAWPSDGGTAVPHRAQESTHRSAQRSGRKSAKSSGGKQPPPSLRDRLLRDAGEVLGTVAVALAIAIVIKTFLVQPFKIPSASMEDTLLIGDRVLVSKLEPGPLSLQRGDVVVFLDPGGWLDGVDSPQQQSLLNQSLTFVGLLPANSGEHLIKRVVGLPGDNVKCCDANGSLLVNNQPIDESSYLYPGDQPSAEEFQVTVPDGALWVMGDHRSVSRDSRFHAVDGDLSAGAVPLDNVVGRAVLVSWPLARWDWLGRPVGVFDGVGQLDGVK